MGVYRKSGVRIEDSGRPFRYPNGSGYAPIDRNESRAMRAFAGTRRPARDLLDNGRYLTLGGMANLQTKRGCRFACAYCTYPHIDGSTVRLRAPKDVVDELASMVEDSRLDEAFFVDVIFNWPYDHAKGICEEIVARRLRVGWTCFATPVGMTTELARAMKRAGCRGVEFGADTASPALLRSLGKPFPQEDLLAAARACRGAALPAAYYLIFGGPGETRRTVEETVELVDTHRPTAVLAFVGVRIYPQTRLHAIAVSEGVVAHEDDLLPPRFYISPAIGTDDLLTEVSEHAKRRPNWVSRWCRSKRDFHQAFAAAHANAQSSGGAGIEARQDRRCCGDQAPPDSLGVVLFDGGFLFQNRESRFHQPAGQHPH